MHQIYECKRVLSIRIYRWCGACALHTYIDFELAERIVQVRNELTNHKPQPVIITGGPIKTSPEARKFAFKSESSELITSWAIVTDESLIKTTFYKLLFFTQNRKRQMRFFNTKEDALKWINLRKELDYFKKSG